MNWNQDGLMNELETKDGFIDELEPKDGQTNWNRRIIDGQTGNQGWIDRRTGN